MGSVDFKCIRGFSRSGASVSRVARAGSVAFTVSVALAVIGTWASAAHAGGGPRTHDGPSSPGKLHTRSEPSSNSDDGGGNGSGRPCRGASLRPTRANLAAIDSATACLIDRARAAAHLRALRANPSLSRVAARQSREMVLGDYFGDDSRSGQTPLQRIVATRYLRHAAQFSTAQNIGWGTDAQATPAAIVAAWMQSPPHREIVLTEEFRDIGVGAAPAAPAALAAGKPGATYTVEFGTRH